MTNPAFVEEWLAGKRPEDFDVIEHLGGRLLWPVKIQRLRSGLENKQSWTEESAYLQALDCSDLIEAVREATRIFDERGFSKDDPRHQALWAEIEMHAHVARALREAADPSGHPYGAGMVHPQKCALEILLSHKASGITRAEVARLYEQLQLFSRFEDARLEQVNKEQAIQVALAIASVRNCSPLVPIAGSAQDTCIVYICDLLSSYLLPKSSSPSPESSPTAP
mgnify:FL=1